MDLSAKATDGIIIQRRLWFMGAVLPVQQPILRVWRTGTAAAISQFEGRALALPPGFFGSALERRMWFKKNFWKVPGRYLILFLYHLLVVGAWRAGRVGWVWARLRTEVYRLWEYKRYEMVRLGHVPVKIPAHPGEPDPRVRLYE